MSAGKIIAVVLAMFVIVTSSARANNPPAGFVGDVLENRQTLSAISPTHTTLQMGVCIGFVDAVLQGWNLRNASGDSLSICMPMTTTEDDVISIFVSWGKSRSQSSQEATLGIFEALREKFPCKK